MQLEGGVFQRPTMLAGSTLWQAGEELAGSGGDDQRWKAVACKLAMVFGSNEERGHKTRLREGMTGVASDSAYANYDIFPKLAHPLNNVALFRGKYVAGQPERCYRTLPPAEMLPRGEALGGYIFVCNNDTMQEDLRRQLFGLPPKYKDSVRAITPGLPLFLYNYTAHQLHGVFQAVSFGGSNIDPTAWEDKKCRGESRFPAQVRIRVKKMCNPLEEDAFRPILHHYDGPKFRLQLSVPEALAVLDLFMNDTASR